MGQKIGQNPKNPQIFKDFCIFSAKYLIKCRFSAFGLKSPHQIPAWSPAGKARFCTTMLHKIDLHLLYSGLWDKYNRLTFVNTVQ